MALRYCQVCLPRGYSHGLHASILRYMISISFVKFMKRTTLLTKQTKSDLCQRSCSISFIIEWCAVNNKFCNLMNCFFLAQRWICCLVKLFTQQKSQLAAQHVHITRVTCEDTRLSKRNCLFSTPEGQPFCFRTIPLYYNIHLHLWKAAENWITVNHL